MRPSIVALILLLLSASACSQAKKAAEAGGLDLDLGNQLTSVFSGASSALGSITDKASAESALPGLQKLDVDLDDITKLVGEASPETKTSLSEIATAQVPGLNELLEKVYAIDGVKPVVQPVMDSIVSKAMAFM